VGCTEFADWSYSCSGSRGTLWVGILVGDRHDSGGVDGSGAHGGRSSDPSYATKTTHQGGGR
jgi:hypothetical protein